MKWTIYRGHKYAQCTNNRLEVLECNWITCEKAVGLASVSYHSRHTKREEQVLGCWGRVWAEKGNWGGDALNPSDPLKHRCGTHNCSLSCLISTEIWDVSHVGSDTLRIIVTRFLAVAPDSLPMTHVLWKNHMTDFIANVICSWSICSSESSDMWRKTRCCGSRT